MVCDIDDCMCNIPARNLSSSPSWGGVFPDLGPFEKVNVSFAPPAAYKLFNELYVIFQSCTWRRTWETSLILAMLKYEKMKIIRKTTQMMMICVIFNIARRNKD